MTFTLESAAFVKTERIPPRYSRDCDNISPPLECNDAPGRLQELHLGAAYDLDVLRARSAIDQSTTSTRSHKKAPIEKLLKEAERHIRGQAEVVGIFERSST
ncbi:hypothetical protein [Pseudaminobacter sp. NGMCC 1.201702]|uniref:hypothetical protein n=1 Tax=Pseudaminobacter sp. NGMCC 1.201702 TaxID=3391825 RepID=UPI0039F14E49